MKNVVILSGISLTLLALSVLLALLVEVITPHLLCALTTILTIVLFIGGVCSGIGAICMVLQDKLEVE